VATILDCRSFSLDLPGAPLLFGKLIQIWGRDTEDASLEAVFRSVDVEPAKLVWSPKYDFWIQALSLAAALGRLRALVEGLADQMASDLRTVLEDLPVVENAPAAPADPNPFGGGLLAQRRPFLDRNPIRAALTDLSSTHGARVLLVDGPPGSGRSHIWFLITHGCSRLGLSPNTAVRIQPGRIALGGRALGPLDLAEEVAQRLEWPRPDYDPQAQPDTHVRILARWFKTNAAAKVVTSRWLVIDDVSNVFMTESAQRMAAEMANAVATDEAGELRIVLLGYNGVLSSDADQYVSRENIVYLGADALKAYFKELAVSVGEQLTGDAVDWLVSRAAGEPPYTVPLPFPQIGAGIGRIAQRYVNTAGAR
jgi:hypothetical protein